ncbi:MAG TPA: spermine synthase, partial [Acidobacteriota bacterium]|nr:spermine synthase [Acidobacteriota bacterium]
MKKRIIAAVILMGFSGLVAQVVLLRELMIAFHGNELSIGIVLANWLMLEAVGAYCLGSAISRARRKLGWFVLTTVFFTVFFLGAIVAARSFREFMPVAPGEGFGLLPMFWVSFLILLPVSVTHGALFTSGCRLFSLFSPSLNSRSRPAGQVDRDAFSIARVYVYETAGTFIGGAALIWLISPLFHSIEIALILALLNIGVCVTLLQPFRRRRKSMTARIAGYCMAALLPGILFMLAGSVGDQIHTLSVKRQWQNQELVYYRNSPYGNIAVVHREGEYTFFTDGL